MARTVTFEVKGVPEMQRRLRQTREQFDRDIRQALKLEAEEIVGEAKERHVPVDLGTLRASGRTGPVRKQGGEYEIRLGFGTGGAEEYALAVHEHPSSHSPRSWQGKAIGDIKSVRSGNPWNVTSGRGPKYLERPLKRAVRSGRLRDRLAKIFGRSR